jgi:hypothetical protein
MVFFWQSIAQHSSKQPLDARFRKKQHAALHHPLQHVGIEDSVEMEKLILRQGKVQGQGESMFAVGQHMSDIATGLIRRRVWMISRAQGWQME